MADPICETWRTCKFLLGKYEVSTLGRIRNLRTQSLMKARVGSTGYMVVSIYWKDNKYKVVKIHRAVAQAFLPPAAEGRRHVNHIDGDRANNVVSNLEWVTPKENVHDQIKRGTFHNVVCLRTNARFSESLKQRIHAMRSSGMTWSAIARGIPIGRTTLKNWKASGLISRK